VLKIATTGMIALMMCRKISSDDRCDDFTVHRTRMRRTVLSRTTMRVDVVRRATSRIDSAPDCSILVRRATEEAIF
jgi:hypothetical protein